MSLIGSLWSRTGTLLAVALLVLAAGCSAVAPPETPAPNAGGGDSTPTSAAPSSTSPPTSPTSPTDDTPTPTTDGTPTPTTTDPSTPEPTPSANADMYRGQIVVVVDGTRLEVAGAGSEGDAVWFSAWSDSKYRIWFTERGDPATLAEALSTLGVDASANAVTYDGTTYRDGEGGVSVNYRVNGDPVNPETYELRSGDKVWVTVETPNADIPGDHLGHDQPHIHGTIDFVVNGESVDFSRDRYQNRDHHFLFEQGHGTVWDAHATTVTLGYAMGTLPGIDVANDRVTYRDETYDGSDDGVTVRILVNGNPVDPDRYVLKDGDHVRIVVNG